jgi:hypothetical protein
MFAEEKPALQQLPVEPFRYYAFGKRPVHLDGCVEIESAYYAPPPGWIGREIHAQWDERVVRLIDLRVPAQADHGFRSMPITDSGRSRSPIPEQADR